MLGDDLDVDASGASVRVPVLDLCVGDQDFALRDGQPQLPRDTPPLQRGGPAGRVPCDIPPSSRRRCRMRSTTQPRASSLAFSAWAAR